MKRLIKSNLVAFTIDRIFNDLYQVDIARPISINHIMQVYTSTRSELEAFRSIKTYLIMMIEHLEYILEQGKYANNIVIKNGRGITNNDI